MRKIKIKVGNSNSESIEFKVDKIKYTAPKILSSFIEDGVEWYNLDNGRSQTKESYNKLWFPTKKKVLPVNYRIDIDSRHIK